MIAENCSDLTVQAEKWRLWWLLLWWRPPVYCWCIPDARWSQMALMQHFVCSQTHCFNRLQHHPENLPFLHVVLYMSCLWYRYCYFFYRQFLVHCPNKKRRHHILTCNFARYCPFAKWYHKRMTGPYSYAKVFCKDVFLLDCGAYVRSLCGCFCVATAKIFFSVNQMLIKSLDIYFSATVFWVTEFLYGGSVHLMLDRGNF